MRPQSTRRDSEQGGIVIVLALILLALMAVAGFSVSQNTLREIAITGNESTGRKAAEAADSGIDWAIMWVKPSTGVDTSTLPQFGKDVLARVANLSEVQAGVGRVFGTDPLPGDAANAGAEPKYGNINSAGVVRLFYRSIDYPTNMGLSAKGSSGFTQDTEVKQAFDVEFRLLGGKSLNGLSTKGASTWIVRTVGRADIGNTGQSFIARREAVAELQD